MNLTLTIHRSASQIGGNCIEIEHPDGDRLILDVGRPLDAPKDARDLLPETLDLSRPASVAISHPHQDHYGLLDELPSDWSVHCGEATEKLIRISANIFGKDVSNSFSHWTAGQAKRIGSFSVTPLLTDHSAFDAHMLLIEAAGKRIIYSGDFRIHGRKSALVDRLMNSPPADIDALLLEGTNLGSDKPTNSEDDLETDFLDLFQNTGGRIFVAWSAQNVDRTVTIYRAAIRANRTLVVDLYTAEVLELLAQHGRLPRAGMRNIKVVITSNMARLYRRRGMREFVDRMATEGRGISISALLRSPERWVIMLRESLRKEYDRKGLRPTEADAWSWSMWSGYLRDVGEEFTSWVSDATAKHIHTSGHASSSHLREFAKAIGPKRLVPIHSFTWEENLEGFEAICRLKDGERLAI